MESLLICGAGELGQAVAEMAQASGKYSRIAFLDDAPDERKARRFPVVGKTGEMAQFAGEFTCVACAFGNNQVRHNLRVKAAELGFFTPSIIHPSVVISPSAVIGEGVIIRENAAISHEVVIEAGCLINMGVLIDHCCVIGADTHLPMGAIVRNEVHIPEMSVFTPGQIIQ